MKRNVDLTENHVFSQGIHIIPAFPVLFEQMGFTFTFHFWDFEHIQMVHSDGDLSGHSSKLVLCGNATQRQSQRFAKSLDAGEICERCGTPLTVKPWARHYCLCQRCDDNLEKEFSYGRFRRFKDDSISQSRDRVVIEMNRRS